MIKSTLIKYKMGKTKNENISNQIFAVDQRALATNNPKQKRRLFNQAIILSKKLLLEDKSVGIWKIYGRALLHAKRFSEASKIYKNCLKLSDRKEKHIFYNSLGNIFRYKASYDSKVSILYAKSIKFYKLAISAAPEKRKGLYWSNLSISYACIKDWDKAIGAAKKAISILEKEEQEGTNHGNQIKILNLELKLYKEYKKRTL